MKAYVFVCLVVAVQYSEERKAFRHKDFEQKCLELREAQETKDVPKMWPGRSFIHFPRNKPLYLLCHSQLPPSGMSFTTIDGLPYTQFANRWQNVQVFNVSCGVAVQFDPLLACQHETCYRCSVKHTNGTVLKYSKEIKLKKLEGPGFDTFGNATGNSLIRVGETLNMTCKLQPIMPGRQKINVSETAVDFYLTNGNGTVTSRLVSNEKFRIGALHVADTNNGFVVQRTMSIAHVQRADLKSYLCVLSYHSCGVVRNKFYTPGPLLDAVEKLPPTEKGFDTLITIICSGLASVFLFVVVMAFLVNRGKVRPPLVFKKEWPFMIKNPQVVTATIQNNNNNNQQGSVEELENQIFTFINGSCSEESVVAESEYDVFLCYSSLDREWVTTVLLKRLESRGVKTCIDFRDFFPGAFISENIETSIYTSKITVAVLSPDFLQSVYCKEELQTAFMRSHGHRVIPVLYKDCVVPPELADITIRWRDEQPFWDQLVSTVKENKPLGTIISMEKNSSAEKTMEG